MRKSKFSESQIMEGEPEAVMDYYNAMLADHQNKLVKQVMLADGKVQTISGTGEAMVTSVALLDAQGREIDTVDVGQPVTLRIEVSANADIARLVLGYGIKDRLGQVIYGTNTDLKQQPLLNIKPGDAYRFDIAFTANPGPGSYSVQTALVSTETHLVNNYEWRDLALVFNVININKPRFTGFAWIDPVIEITRA